MAFELFPFVQKKYIEQLYNDDQNSVELSFEENQEIFDKFLSDMGFNLSLFPLSPYF